MLAAEGLVGLVLIGIVPSRQTADGLVDGFKSKFGENCWIAIASI